MPQGRRLFPVSNTNCLILETALKSELAFDGDAPATWEDLITNEPTIGTKVMDLLPAVFRDCCTREFNESFESRTNWHLIVDNANIVVSRF